jgi:dihydropyrimidine dehydrogenase (NAD+) subunit PreT
VGQKRHGNWLEAAFPGIALDGGKVRIDPGGRTSVARLYAGGDCVNGGKEVVNAVADGKAAARAIDADLGRPRG